jgi:hypothetical protein
MQQLALFALSILVIDGCGMVANGFHQPVLVDSVPTNTEVQIDGKRYTTPVILDLRRGQVHTVICVNGGGASVTRNVYPSTNGVVQLLDFVTLPLIANVVDTALGTDTDLRPDALVIPAPPLGAGPEFNSPPPGGAL